jgi:hypothetical protein
MPYHYSRFVIEQGDPLPRKEELAAAMIGLLFNTVDYTTILTADVELTTHCVKGGFQPIYRIISTVDDLRDMARDTKAQLFMGRFGAGLHELLTQRDQQLVMMGPIMLTIGKNIQLEGYSSWMTNHIRAFMGTLGLESNSILWNDPVYPCVTAMNTLSTYLSASYWIRREIFRICWAVSSEINTETNLFKDVISLLKGTSMTHILIDEYLYSRYRELLSIRLLADNHNGMVRAWEYLATSTS